MLYHMFFIKIAVMLYKIADRTHSDYHGATPAHNSPFEPFSFFYRGNTYAQMVQAALDQCPRDLVAQI